MATALNSGQSLLHLSVAVPDAWEDAAGMILEAQFGQTPSVFCRPESRTSELSLYLEDRQRPSRRELATLRNHLLALADLGLPPGTPRIKLISLKQRDWQESWKHHFKPFEVGRRLLLKPSWSRRKPRRGQAVVVLDPGLSFGTGQHPTTRFCLRELARARRPELDQSLLDIGTGSGILAIAAVKLGYAPVHAFDLDENAVRVARTNARRNRVLQNLRITQADLVKQRHTRGKRWDVVCANLLANLLIAEVSTILARVERGGVVVLAGILGREFHDVDRVYYCHGAVQLRAQTEGEWCSASYRVVS